MTRTGRTATSLVVAVAVLAVLAVGVVAAWRVLGPRLDGLGDVATVPVPDRGEVAAAFVRGRPVFVLRADDDTVTVLDAVSPHDGSFVKVLAWCRTSGLLEDLWHGSKFAPTGAWVGGPAPTGLARYEVQRRVAGRLVVGERGAPPPRGEPPHDEDPVLGPACDERTALYAPGNPVDPDVLDDLVVHDVRGRDPGGRWYPTPDRVMGRVPPGPAG